MTTASLVGLAFSPVLAGLVGASGLRVVFVVDVVLLLGLAALVAARMRPAVADASALPPGVTEPEA
jgi:MFS family permease